MVTALAPEVRDLTAQLKRPALRYHGGKWQIAPHIIEHFPPHDCYVEPYGGGASVMLRKERTHMEVYNDLSKRIGNFFRVLREHPDALIYAISLTPYSRSELQSAIEYYASWDGRLYPEPDVEAARCLYVLSGQCRHGASAQRNGGWRYRAPWHGGSPVVQDWDNVGHLWQIAERLKQVYIECAPALEVIRRYDSPNTLFYADPPYPKAVRNSHARMYDHDHLTDGAHELLAETLHGISGMGVISGYRCALYDTLYSDWSRFDIRATTQYGKYRTESVWLSPRAAQVTHTGQARLPLGASA